MSPTVELGNFVGWVRNNTQRISEVYGEIEEVQQRFNGAYTALLADWQEQVESAAVQLAALEDPPPSIVGPLGQKSAAEREKLEARIAELTAEAKSKREKAESALLAAQDEISHLRELNPVLNQREESIKATALQQTERIAQLEEELGATGFLDRLLGQRELKARIRAAQEEHEVTLKELHDLREEWVRKKKEAEERQAELRQVWQAASVEAAQAQAELDYLAENLETLAAQRGGQAYLVELKQAPPVGGKLEKTLSRIVELNQSLADYRAGLASVAEGLGLLSGIRTGMARFLESADKVYEEQQRYNLRKLRLDLPKEVVQFHNIWIEFRKQVRDDKRLGARPLEFAQIVERYAKNHLTDRAIQDMFVGMGHALTQATKAWG